MKRFLALFLALVMIFGMVPALGTTAKAETTASTEDVSALPFYGLTWSPVNRDLFGNLEDAPVLQVNEPVDGIVTMSGSGDFAAKAAEIKTILDALPEGMRYVRIQHPGRALQIADSVIYADEGAAQLKALVTGFIEAYYAIGGQLDGIITDTEYTAMGDWYLYGTWGGYYDKNASATANRNLYNDIVADPRYETEIKPLLVERGFTFYEKPSGSSSTSSYEWRSEIWSIFPNQIWGNLPDSEEAKFNTVYKNCASIWNKVMYNRIAEYITEAIYEPMAARYPDGVVSDYKVADTATWEHYMTEGGGLGYYAGNSDKIGNASDMNMYNANPNSGFFMDGDTYLYKNIQSYNKAVYDDDAYNSMLFYVNRFKSIYAATDTKKLSAWIAEYDYDGRNNSVKNSPYYAEVLYHIGLLNPLPFKIYMFEGDSKFEDNPTKYNECMQVISQILNELTRVAGYSDRRPIETPQAWNDGFVLSGMYANGRNIWRLTPDTTDGMTLADFKVAGTVPTFSINGNTITFPGGKVLSNGAIDVVGTCGYWIETAADVQPVITREADRYAKNPSYLEAFNYTDGTVFNSDNAKEKQAWVASSDLLIESGALALTGTATLDNVKLPKNITAGDTYAKQQAWELSFTLADALSAGNVTLFNGLVKLENNKVYYSQNGSYVELAAISAGTKYTINVNNNFNNNTATYTLSAEGAVVAQADGIAVTAVTLPVETITLAATGVTTKVLVDDYKLYPTGFEYEIKFFDGNTGVYQAATEKLTNEKVAFRLPWMNATSVDAKAQIHVARYDNSGNLVSDTVLRSFDMKANWDGVETGVLENTTGSLTVYLHICKEDNTELQGQKDATCSAEGYTGDLVCKDCGEIFKEGTAIKKLGHTKETIKGKAATCTEPGLSVGEKCTVCGEIVTPQEEIPALGHAWEITGNGYPATCTTPGKTDKTKCTRCGKIENAVDIPALGHTESDPVKENVVEGSCTQDASYDMVVYCATCGEVISRETVTNAAAGHTEEIISGKDATCTEDGLTEGKKCSVCGEILVEQTAIPATGHTPGEPVKEKAVAPYYELAVYCTTCNVELSRESFNDYTVTLWGTAYTIKDTEPTEYYWVNGAEGEVPVAVTADDNWNYRFMIIEGVPTVTIRNAEYSYTATFLKATYDGKLKLAYEGDNEIVVPYKASSGYQFVSYSASSNSAGAGKMYIEGAEAATLKVTGGSKAQTMLAMAKKAYLYITGGTFSIERTNAGGVNAVVSTNYGRVYVENCNLTVKNNTGVGNQHPAFVSGGLMSITNSDVHIEGNTLNALCVAIFYSNMTGYTNEGALTINGNSNVTVINKQAGDYTFGGRGIYAKSVTINGGNLEVTGVNQAVVTSSGNAPVLTSYDGQYNMYTAVGGDPVSEYTATTYFKVKYLCPHTSTTTTEQIVDSTCTVAGTKTTTVTCDECGSVISEEIVELPLADHTESIVPGKDATCTETGLTDGKVCTACGEVLKEQTEIPMIDHVAGEPVKENVVEVTETQDGSYDLVERCAACGEELSREPIIVPVQREEPSNATYTLVFSTGNSQLTLSLTSFDTPAYAKNTTKNGIFAKNATDKYDYIAQTTGSEENWNAKLIWHSGDEGPTLYLDGFTIDTYNETVQNYVYRSSSAQSYYAAIYTGTEAPLKIVLTGEDSYIRNFTGITYRNQLTIESDGDTMLTMIGRTGIGPRNTSGALYATNNADISGYKLILDANMDITVQHAGYWGHGILCTVGADMIINGGNINLTSTVVGRVLMKAKNSGNIIINGGNVNAGGSADRGIWVWPDYNVYVNGGSLAAYGNFYAMYASSANSPGKSDTTTPVLPENGNYTLWQGDSSETAKEVTTLISEDNYFKVDFGPECEHIEEIVPGKAATCTEVGYTEGKICTVCGKRTVLRKEIPALGHIEVVMPSRDVTCTVDGLSEGKKCSTCAEVLVAQIVIPALGHTYDDVTDIDCNTCGAIRPTITVEGNKVSVHLNGVASAKTHTFYVEGKNVADINNWNELKATGTLYTYSAYEFTLKKAGDYVLRLEYYDSEGVRAVASYPVTIEETDDTATPACKPEFIVNDNLVTVKYNGATNMKVHAFHVEGKEIADINYWSALKAADPNFKTYSKNIIPLTKVGRYILRAEYTDTTGAKCNESFEVNVACVPVSVTVAQQNVTVNIDGATNVKVFAFFVEEGESVSNIYDWNELKSVDPEFKTYLRNSFKLPEIGRYVLRVQYVDAKGVTRAVSYMAITSLIVPEATMSGAWVKITPNGLTVQKVHVFNIDGQEIADINDWYELKAEANSYKAYSKTSFTLKNSGTYVLRIEFIDRTGKLNKTSQLINFEP